MQNILESLQKKQQAQQQQALAASPGFWQWLSSHIMGPQQPQQPTPQEPPQTAPTGGYITPKIAKTNQLDEAFR